MLKVIIVILLIGVIVSLFSGLFFLFKDVERTDSRRTLHALGIRITLAAALLATVFYGFYTGQLRLGTNAPWHEDSTQTVNETQPDRADPAEPAGPTP